MNLKLFYIYKITGNLLPVYPIYVLYFQHKGLSLSTISLLLIIWSIPGLILEIPSSILADRWNRRNLLIISRIFKVLCFIVWGVSDGFFGFAMGFILWGTGGALTSGTEEAWLYDYLRTKSKEAEFDRIWGKCTFYSQLAVGISGITGSLIATISMPLTIWISVGLTFISMLVAMFLQEYNLMIKQDISDLQGISDLQDVSDLQNKSKIKDIHGSFYILKSWLNTLIDGAQYCLTYKFVPLMIGFSVTVLITAGVLDEYDQLIVRYMGLPLGLVGLWAFARYGMEALGGYVAWRFKKLFKKLSITKPFIMQLCLAMISGVLLLFTAGFPVIALLPFYGMYYFLMSSARVLFTDSLQKNIEHQGRATIQSLASMLEAPGAMLIYAIIGIVGGNAYLREAMAVVAVWILVLCVLFWILQGRKRYSKDCR